MDAATRQLVRSRARERCEYCRIPQAAVDATFHIDHVIAQQHLDDADDSADSLALACDRCNLHKGTNLTSIDPESNEIVVLFNPRSELWESHFVMKGPLIVGFTPTGRATARLLQMNAKHRVRLRHWLIQLGEFP